MHDSPRYAQLRTVEQLHAECKQRMQGLASLIEAKEIPDFTRERVSQTLRRVERLFRTLETEIILDTCPVRDYSSAQERSLRADWNWISDELETMMKALEEGQTSPSLCDSLVSKLDQI